MIVQRHVPLLLILYFCSRNSLKISALNFFLCFYLKWCRAKLQALLHVLLQLVLDADLLLFGEWGHRKSSDDCLLPHCNTDQHHINDRTDARCCWQKNGNHSQWSIFTQWIMWDAFENDAVGCKKESSLCWQDVWPPQETPSSFLPAIRVQKHPQPLWHHLLSRKQCWTEDLGLVGKEQRTMHEGTGAAQKTQKNEKQNQKNCIYAHMVYEQICQDVTPNVETSVTESDFQKCQEIKWLLTRQLPTLQDFDREEALTHMHIIPLSKTHILQANKEFDGIDKKKNQKTANKNIITFSGCWGKSLNLFFI